MMQYWGYGTGYNPGFSLIGFIFQALFWGLIVLLIVRLFKGSHHSHCCHGHDDEIDETMDDRSLGIIKERYAKGEIDKKEFEQLKKDLS